MQLSDSSGSPQPGESKRSQACQRCDDKHDDAEVPEDVGEVEYAKPDCTMERRRPDEIDDAKRRVKKGQEVSGRSGSEQQRSDLPERALER